MTIFATPGTAVLSGPDEVIRFRVKMEYSLAKSVRYGRSLGIMPRAASVRRVEDLLSGSDRIRTVGRVFVVVKRQERFFGVVLDPAVPFVARLPE